MLRRMILLALLLAGISVAQAAPPSGPFTPDANTLLLMHFDGDLADASATGASSAFSAIAGHTDPSFIAGNTGFGQAVSANGGTVNGVVINTPALSLTPAPITVECWMRFPAARQADDYTNTVLDLGAGRFLFRIRHEAGGNYVYPMLNIYNEASVAEEYSYASVSTAAGFSEDTWHHFAVVLDPAAPDGAKFYFDGTALLTESQTTPPAVTSDFNKISYPGATAGRVWPPAAPTSNLIPLIGAMDELRLSSGDRYGAQGDANVLLDLRFDGNLNDSSVYARNGAFTNVGGFSNPTYVAARDTTAGQALEGTGVSMNSVVVAANELSQTTGPITVEAWMRFPSADATAEYTNTVLDLGAARFIFTVRHEIGGNNLIPTLGIYNDSLQPELSYAVVPQATGWAHDQWHRFAVTYDPARTPVVEMFLDNQKLGLTAAGVVSPFNKVAFAAMVAGRSHVGDNSQPLRGQIDDVRLVRGILYGGVSNDPVVFDYHFENNLLDSGPNGYNASLTAIGGFSDPNYTTGQSGQSISGGGGNINGVVIPNTIVSLTSSPLTAEAWFYVPVNYIADEFNINIVDLSAGRFNFFIRHAGAPDSSIYLTLGIYTATNEQQQNYAPVTVNDGWTHDAWHHVAVTYDPGRQVPVEFYFDGRRMGLQTPESVAAISDEFAKVAEPALIAGRVWPPSAPTVNLMPLKGRVDGVKLTRDIVYTFTDQSVPVYADLGTSVTVDGNAADWAALGSDEVSIDTGGRGGLEARLRYAWDSENLYILVREAGNAGAAQEAASKAAYEAEPYNFDTIGVWFDLDNSNEGEQVGQDFTPWFGFSSTGRTDLFTARINNAAAFTQAPFIGAVVRTSGTFAARNRVIEAAIKWSDLALVVDGPRQPYGNLEAAITPGLRFGAEPMLIENDYNKQSFIGGAQFAVPAGIDVNSRDIILRGVNASAAWELYQ